MIAHLFAAAVACVLAVPFIRAWRYFYRTRDWVAVAFFTAALLGLATVAGSMVAAGVAA